MNGLQCLEPFAAFLRWGCGPRLSAKQYTLRLPFCCCAAENTRAKPAGSSCLPDHPARLPNSWGHGAPAGRGLLLDSLASSFLLHGAALAAPGEGEPGEGEMFSVCLEERQTWLRLVFWVSPSVDLFSALEG